MLVRGETEVASWSLSYPGCADLDVVDRLARARLAARRAGLRLVLRGAAQELVELLDLVGLRQVLGQAEDGEEIGVEEVVVTDDPVT